MLLNNYCFSRNAKIEGTSNIKIVKNYKTDVVSKQNGFTKETFVSDSGRQLSYQLHMPENFEKGVKYPILLHLHGAANIGTDNESQMPNFIQSFDVASDLLKDAIILCPPKPLPTGQ